jgi:hypothetical protein
LHRNELSTVPRQPAGLAPAKQRINIWNEKLPTTGKPIRSLIRACYIDGNRCVLVSTWLGTFPTHWEVAGLQEGERAGIGGETLTPGSKGTEGKQGAGRSDTRVHSEHSEVVFLQTKFKGNGRLGLQGPFSSQTASRSFLSPARDMSLTNPVSDLARGQRPLPESPWISEGIVAVLTRCPGPCQPACWPHVRQGWARGHGHLSSPCILEWG